MRTHLEFKSSDFPPILGEEEQVNPGRYGKRFADFLAAGLPSHGFEVAAVTPEDWGWRIDLRNEAFPLWVGCGNYDEYENGFLCFIEPSRPSVGRWLRRTPVLATVERLATAIEGILREGGRARELRWWTEVETHRG